MTRDAEHTPSPQSVVVPLEDWQHVIGALKNAKARLPMGAAIGNISDALSKVEHLQAAPAPSSLAGGDRIGAKIRLGVIAAGKTITEAYHPSTFSDPVKQFWRDLAALSPEAPARVGVEALRTALIKARSELAIQYCYSAGRMGIAGCYPELAEKYGGSAIVQEIDAVLAPTPRHEAPASPTERELDLLDAVMRAGGIVKTAAALPDKAAHLSLLTDALNRADAILTEGLNGAPVRYEAPAEGAREDIRLAIAKIVDPEVFTLIAHYTGIDRFDGLSSTEREPAVFKAYPDLQASRDAALADADRIIALRARSSAPEAREGEAVRRQRCTRCDRGEVFGMSDDSGFWVEFSSVAGGANEHGMNGWLELVEHWPDGRDVRREYVAKDSPLYAAPSADKLRIAVEALEAINAHRIGRDPPNVWTGSDICRGIATKALAALKVEGA